MIVTEEFLHGIGCFNSPAERLREPTEDEMYYGLIIPYNWASAWINEERNSNVNRMLPVENLPAEFRAAVLVDPEAWDFCSQFHIQRAFRENRLYCASGTATLHMYPFGVQAYTKRVRSIALAKQILAISDD